MDGGNIFKLYLALDVACRPGVVKPQQNQELSHWSHRQKSQVDCPFFGSSLSSEDLGSPSLQEEDCDTDVLNRFKIKNKDYSFLLVSILTVNRRRITAWRGKPVIISIIMVNTSETSPMTSMTTPIERKSPIRESLPMQKNTLSIIFCRSPMSLMEPWEPEDFLERLLDPLRPALWKNNHRFIYYLIFQSTLTRGFISILWESESFG